MNIKTTRNELKLISEIIDRALYVSTGIKLNDAMIAIGDKIEEIRKRLERSINHSEDYKEYQNKRIALCIKYCDRDSNGDPIINNGIYQGLEGNQEFNEDLSILNSEYEKAIKDNESINIEYERIMAEEIDFEFEPIDKGSIPDGIFTGHNYKLMRKFIK